jgi:hypothetical protein
MFLPHRLETELAHADWMIANYADGELVERWRLHRARLLEIAVEEFVDVPVSYAEDEALGWLEHMWLEYEVYWPEDGAAPPSTGEPEWSRSAVWPRNYLPSLWETIETSAGPRSYRRHDALPLNARRLEGLKQMLEKVRKHEQPDGYSVARHVPAVERVIARAKLVFFTGAFKQQPRRIAEPVAARDERQKLSC